MRVRTRLLLYVYPDVVGVFPDDDVFVHSFTCDRQSLESALEIANQA